MNLKLELVVVVVAGVVAGWFAWGVAEAVENCWMSWARWLELACSALLADELAASAKSNE